MNFKVQRYQPGDKYYTNKLIENTFPEHGLIGVFGSVFGQLVDVETGEVICYTLERFDTLISEGTRKYKLYFSPLNHTVVMLFEDEPGSGTYDRKFEFHIVNWAYQLKGCTGGGSAIDLDVPMLTGSTSAFKKVMALVGSETGTITHEKYQSKT